MSFQIDQGLFKFDFIDNHAILGVPISADSKEVRKRYLKIARRLHPDSLTTNSDAVKHQATQLLSKLVNPAYEKLSKDQDLAEYMLLLKLKGQYAAQQQAQNNLQSEAAKSLMTAGNLDHAYTTALKELAEKQYETPDKIMAIIGQLSELNLAYLMRKEGTSGSAAGRPIATSSAPPAPAATAKPGSAPPKAAPAAAKAAPEPAHESVAEQYCRRAEGFMAKKNYAKAILELRDALQVEPNSSRIHSLLGMVYFQQNQVTMARIHFDQALKYNPQDETALKGKRAIDQKTGGGKKEKEKKSGGGLFGLFGGKKK
ncbi:J domain-containing protein [Geitlerinema sp. PCC 7407]|uniref:J domain-containing protein n=1 Tax=Geitlerinema sp. PCC 7407 TaxID=1173025 RepID=UPI00029FABF2|nr:J domain-containing protein [Geitlerinema sp. PCC 7407]AFY65580.1 heat shock protein DnaJ domain protein [Geitlerinema sp. PCC 7407]